MAPRTTFANLQDGLQLLNQWDQVVADTGNLGIIPCTCTGTNALVLTPLTAAFAPTQSAYANYRQYSAIAAATSTGPLTANVAGIGVRDIYLDNGVTQATTGDIVINEFFVLAFASTLNGGAGGFYLLAAGSTSVPLLNSNRTYYVRKDGSDFNSGLINNASGAFLTIQHAMNIVGGLYLNGYDVTIAIGDGNYPESVKAPAMLTGDWINGGGAITLLGNTTTPANVEIGGSSFSGTSFSCSNIGNYVLDGVRLTSNAGRLIDINAPGVTVTLKKVEFNQLGSISQSSRTQFGSLRITGPVSIISSGSAGSIFSAQIMGNVTLNGTPALVFPVSPIGAGQNLFYANDLGYFQVDTVTTFTNAANWAGVGAKVTLRGFVQINVAQASFPGGTSIQNDGTGITTFNNLTVATGAYFENPNGSLAWIGQNGLKNIFDPTANTANRIYTLPDASIIVAGTNLAQTFTAAQVINATLGIGTLAADCPITINQNTGQSVVPAAGTNLHLVGADGVNNEIGAHAYGVGEVAFRAYHAGGTQTSKTGTPLNTNLFSFVGNGWNTSAYVAGIAFQMRAAELWTSSAQGTFFRFQTTPTGSTTLTSAFYIQNSGGISVGTASDPGLGMIYTNSASFMIRTKTSYTNGAAAGAGTVTNAPTAGNPTKWIPVDDNGTTRFIPAW